jgi:hypothetical protein
MDQDANAVRVAQIDGKWTVLIIERGKAEKRDFEKEEYALNFADGQRARLGLSTTDRPAGKRPR